MQDQIVFRTYFMSRRFLQHFGRQILDFVGQVLEFNFTRQIFRQNEAKNLASSMHEMQLNIDPKNLKQKLL